MQPNFTCSPELTEYAYRDECNNIFMFNGTRDLSPWYQTTQPYCIAYIAYIAYDQIKFRLRPNSHITDFFRPLKGNLLESCGVIKYFQIQILKATKKSFRRYAQGHIGFRRPLRVRPTRGYTRRSPVGEKKLSRDLEQFAFPVNMTVRGFTKIIDFQNPFPNQHEINF